MAKQKPGGKRGKPKTPAAAAPASKLPEARVVGTRRDPRRWIYATLDMIFAVVYALVVTEVVRTRVPFDQLLLLTLPYGAALMAVGIVVGRRAGWWISVIGCAALLLSAVILIIVIVVSASFLAGVYGALGMMAAVFALLAAALMVEAVVLVPLFQLKFLMTRSGRRSVGGKLGPVSAIAAALFVLLFVVVRPHPGNDVALFIGLAVVACFVAYGVFLGARYYDDRVAARS
jgi:hypothetical protein